MENANIRETKNVIKAMTYEEQLACAEALPDEVLAQSFSLRLVKYGAEISALKEFVKKI